MENETLTRANIEQWTKDPCGAVYAQNAPEGSKEYFKKIASNRYRLHAPWLPAYADFARYAGKKVLEIGCGMGIDLAEFAKAGALVSGVDVTPKSIELAQKHFAVFGLQGELVNRNAKELPFPDDTFDLVYSCGVLHHIPEVEDTVKEVYRVLKPGGEIKILLYYKNSLNYWLFLWFLRGVLQGEFFRGKKMPYILSRYVEYSESGELPYVRVYDKKEMNRLFRDFSSRKIEIHHLHKHGIPYLGRVVPDFVFKALEPYWGWYICLNGKKT